MATPEQAPVQTFQSDDQIADSIAALRADVIALEEEGDAATPPVEEPVQEAAPEEPEVKPETEEPAEGETEGSDEDPVFEVTLPGGETSEIPLSELAAGYSRLQDYKAKTSELAQQKREFEEARQTELARVQQTQGQLQQVLEHYQSMNPVGNPPPISMLDPNSQEYNPDKYHLEKANYEKRLGEYYQSSQQLQQARQQAEAIEAQRLATTTQAEKDKLKEAWPEFYDQTKAPEVRSEFLNGLKQHYGIDPKTVETVLDHRFYVMARDAIAYRAVKKDAPQVSAKLKIKPKVVKPGTRTQSNPQTKQLADARANLRRTGKDADATNAFLQLVDKGLI
jgi:hypothetical protein